MQPPIWKKNVNVSGFAERNRLAIEDENRRLREDESRRLREQDASQPRSQPMGVPKMKSGIGTVKFDLGGGVWDERDAEELADDPVYGGVAHEALWKRDMKSARDEADSIGLELSNPSLTGRLTKEQRDEILTLGKEWKEDNPKHIEGKAKLIADEKITAMEQKQWEAKKRMQELSRMGPKGYQEYRQQQKLQSVAQASKSIAQQEADIQAKDAEGVSGRDLQAHQAAKQDILAKKQDIQQQAQSIVVPDKRVTAVTRNGVTTEYDPNAKPKTLDDYDNDLNAAEQKILDAEKSGQADPSSISAAKAELAKNREMIASARKEASEAEARKIAIESIGVGFLGKQLSGKKSGGYEKVKDYLNDVGFGGLFHAAVNPLEAAKVASDEHKIAIDRAISDLNDKGYSKEDAARIVQDAAKEYAWTADTKDSVRELSSGSMAINPALIFGDNEALKQKIQSTGNNPEKQSEALERLDSMRKAMAKELKGQLYSADYDFKAFADERKGTDDVTLLDEWRKSMTDRNGIVKFADVVLNEIANGGYGVIGTGKNITAGVAAMVGADQIAGSVGQSANELNQYVEQRKMTQVNRGLTGTYGVIGDVTNTATQMVPMLVGGEVAAAMKPLLATVTRVAAVEGTAFAQGAGSKYQDAVDLEKEKLGRDLSNDEIAEVLGRKETQIAAFSNGAQAALLNRLLPGGPERIVTSGATRSMTVLDFLSKGGRKAIRDAGLKAELKQIGKTMFADAKDEMIEEGINQMLDGIISTAALGKDMKLGDLLEESFHAAMLGGLVGGAMPQARFSKAETTAAALVAQGEAAPTPEEQRKVDEIAGADADVDQQVQYTKAQREIAAAEPEVAERANATLKLARGASMDELTANEVRALGVTRDGAPLSPDVPALVEIVNGRPIVLDGAIQELEAIAPAAKGLVTMTEGEARTKFSKQPFTVTSKSGAVIQVEAKDAAEAEKIGAQQFDLGDGVETVTLAATGGGNSPPPAPAPTGTTTAQPVADQTAIDKTVQKLRTRLGKLVNVTNDPKVRVHAVPDLIEINPEALKAEAAANGLDDAQAAKWINDVVDEEVRHLAQHSAARDLYAQSGDKRDFEEWRDEHYAMVWNTEFVATGKDAMVRKLYGDGLDSLPEWKRAMEGIRMMWQRKENGNPTEIAKLWTKLSATMIEELKAVLRQLRAMVKNLTPEMKRELALLQSKLKEIENEQNDKGPAKEQNPASETITNIADQPSPNLAPRATENAPPSPARKDYPSRNEYKQASDEWFEKYAKTHNENGTPIQPTVLDEVVAKATKALTGKSIYDAIDAIGTDIGVEMRTGLTQLLNDGWVWDDTQNRMVDTQGRGESAVEALRRIRGTSAGASAKEQGKPQTPVQVQPVPTGTPEQGAKPAGTVAPSVGGNAPAPTAKIPEPTAPAGLVVGQEVTGKVTSENDVDHGKTMSGTVFKTGEKYVLVTVPSRNTPVRMAVDDVKVSDKPVSQLAPQVAETPSATTETPTNQKDKPSDIPSATLTFPSRSAAQEFATAWGRHSTRGHDMSATKQDGTTQVTIYKLSGENKKWVDSYVAQKTAETPKSAEKPKKPAAPKKSRIGRALPRHLELFMESPVVRALIDSGGVMSKSAALKKHGKDWMDLNKSLWEDIEALKNPSYNVIYGGSNANLPDQAASELFTAGVIKEDSSTALWEALVKAVQSTRSVAEQEKTENAKLSQAEDFARVKDDGPYRVNVDEMSTGDKLVIDGENFTVTTVTRKDGEVAKAILEDGTRFGRQTVEGGEDIWVEEFDDGAPEMTADDAAERDAADQARIPKPEPVATKPAPKLPATKMDVAQTNAKELFADDGGFALSQQTTQDGDKVAKAKADAEAAKEAADKAQGKLFDLTAAEKATEKAFEGLFAAPLSESFTENIPADKIGGMINAASQLIADGVRTPEAMAAALTRIEQANGKPGALRKYSEAFWSAFRMVDTTLAKDVDWAKVYEPTSQNSPNEPEASDEKIPLSTPSEILTLSRVSDFFSKLKNGDVTASQVKTTWEQFKNSKFELKKELAKMTMAQLAKFQGMRKPANKSDAVNSAYNALESKFNPTDSLSYMMSGDMKKAHADAMDAKVELWTDDLIAQKAGKKKPEPVTDNAESPIVLWGRHPNTTDGKWVRLTDNTSNAEVKRREAEGWEVLKYPQNQNPSDIEKVPVEPKVEALPETAVESTADIVSFSPEQAASELAKRGITIEKGTTKTGKPVWEIKGKTFDVKDALKSLGAKWYNPKKSWSIYSDDNPTQKIADALAGKSAQGEVPQGSPDGSRTGGNADEDLRLRELRERLDSNPDERGTRRDAISSVNADTANLIRIGLTRGMPQSVVDDQIEDIAMITKAYVSNKPMFVLGNGAGTGKTFVLGGAIREMRSKGATSFVYVTMNTDLIEQIKRNLANYGIGDVSFHTYSEMSKNGINMPKGSVLIFDEAHNVKNEDSSRGGVAQGLMSDAKFTIFASATPFENPVEAGYVAGTGIFNQMGGHTEFAKAYGANVRKVKGYDKNGGQIEKEYVYWTAGKLEDGIAARQWFTRQGIMITRPMQLPMDMVDSMFAKHSVDQKWVSMYNKVEQAYEDAMSEFRDENGNILDQRNNAMVAMHMINTIKRILEAAKVQQSVKRAQEILSNGGNVVIFVETKADRWIGRYRASTLFDKKSPLYTYPQMRDMMDDWEAEAAIARKMSERPGPRPFAESIMSIARAMHSAGIEYELPSVEQELVDQLGGKDKVGVYTGSVTSSAASKDKAAFLSGQKKVIVATMAKGGTGLSLHDEVGDRQTSQINLNLPWKASGVDQVSARVARYGLQSKAYIEWLFADNIPFERSLAYRVGRRMRDMGAIVKGVDTKAANVLSDGFDFEGSVDVKQVSGEVKVSETDIFEQAERLEKSRRQRGDQSNGFFETPFTLSALMTVISGARGRLLEPSAGRGNLVRFAKDSDAVTSITMVEQRADNADYLEGLFVNDMDGARNQFSKSIVIRGDFLDEAAKLGKFDSIHMNPPFERKAGVGAQDVAHVMQAYELLSDDGRLVAIMGEGAFFRSTKQEQEFRQWLNEVGAIVVKLPENAFKNSNTGVRARMVIIDRNADSGRTDINLDDMSADSLRSVADAIPARQSSSTLSAAPLSDRDADYIIPLSQRFDSKVASLKNIVTPETDAAYLLAVKSGDIEKADQLLVATAQKYGAIDPDGNGKLYHGTKTEFSQFKVPAFFTDDKEGIQFQQDTNRDHDYGNIIKPYFLFGKYEEIEIDEDLWAIRENEDFYIEQAQSKGFDGVIFTNGYDFFWVAFDPAKILSADPVTYDENGEVIPLSQRFNPENDSILSAAPLSDRDADYMAAVKAGDMETAQRMVDEAARAAGYDLERYHITPYTFTQFRTPSEFTDEPGMQRLLDSFEGENVMRVYIKATRVADITRSNIDADNKKQVAKYAKENNLDAVTIDSNWGDAQDIIVINPSQIKSADPVVRDDNGDIIPLSQRFNPESDSILYAGNLSDRARAEMDEGAIKETMAQQKEFGNVVQPPNRASMGDETTRKVVDAFDIDFEQRREKESREQWVKQGTKKAATGRKDLIENALMNAYGEVGAVPMQPEDMIGTQIVIEQMVQEAGNNYDKLIEAGTIIQAYRKVRGDIARVLASGWDRLMPPDERNRRALSNAILTLPPKIQKDISKRGYSPEKTRELIQKTLHERLQKVEKALNEYGVTINEVLGKQVYLSLNKKNIVKDIMAKNTKDEQLAIRMHQQAYDIQKIAKSTHMSVAEVQKLINKVYNEALERMKAKARAGVTLESLQAAMLSEAEIEAEARRMVEIGLGISPTPHTASTRLKKRRAIKTESEPQKVNWARPEFTSGLLNYTFDTKDLDNIKKTVQALIDATAAKAKVESITDPKQRAKAEALLENLEGILSKYETSISKVVESGKPLDSYRFDISDRAHVAIIANAIRSVDADWIDKGVEYSYFSMLSGLQTFAKNLSSVPWSAFEATIQRGSEIVLNQFFKNPMNATLKEVEYMARAMGPLLDRAKSNFLATLSTGVPFFEQDILGAPPDLEKVLEGYGMYHRTAISGRKGELLRTFTRSTTAVDEYVKTVNAMIEVGAMAYRLCRAAGLTPNTPEFDQKIKELVNVPGSLAWQLAAKKAYQRTFTDVLPGEVDPTTGKKRSVRTIGDVIGRGAKAIGDFGNMETETMLAKLAVTLFRLGFFPFVKIPYNITATAFAYTPLGFIDIVTLSAQYLWEKRTGKKLSDPKIAERHKFELMLQKGKVIEQMSKFMLGNVLTGLLLGFGWGEGDDDDLEKALLITGSRPYKETGKGVNEVSQRMGIEAYTISWKKKNGQRGTFNYGGIEPLATILATNIDTIKEIRRATAGKQTYNEALGHAAHSFANQLSDKSFLQGFGDLWRFSAGETDMSRYAADKIGMIMPNLIKQIVRESDPVVRGEADNFAQDVAYAIMPIGDIKKAKVDIYGNEVMKRGSVLTRWIDFTESGSSQVNPIDEMLWRYYLKNPKGESLPSSASNFYMVDGKRVEMTENQASMYRKRAGLHFNAELKKVAGNLNYLNPTDKDIKTVKNLIEESRRLAKKSLSSDPNWK